MPQPKAYSFFFIATILLLLVLFLLSVGLGSVNIPLTGIIATFTDPENVKSSWRVIIMDFRLPKAFTTILAGAALAVSGLQMQTLFRNPLAGPFVLGISSGASLGVAFAVMAGQFLGISWLFGGPWMTVIAATAGAFLVFLFVLTAASRLRDSMALLIVGLMFGSATGAIVSILQYFSEAEQIKTYLFWTFGSLGGLNWQELGIFALIVALGTALALSLMKRLNALLLGENYAASLGLKIKQQRLLIIISTSLLAGSTTAFCGPIAFIGIAIPHFARLLLRTSQHQVLLPACLLLGAVLMLACDIIAQMPGAEQVLPINAVTSLLGAPVVIWLILKRGPMQQNF